MNSVASKISTLKTGLSRSERFSPGIGHRHAQFPRLFTGGTRLRDRSDYTERHAREHLSIETYYVSEEGGRRIGRHGRRIVNPLHRGGGRGEGRLLARRG